MRAGFFIMGFTLSNKRAFSFSFFSLSPSTDFVIAAAAVFRLLRSIAASLLSHPRLYAMRYSGGRFWLSAWYNSALLLTVMAAPATPSVPAPGEDGRYTISSEGLRAQVCINGGSGGETAWWKRHSNDI
jgi:hypothetical protein